MFKSEVVIVTEREVPLTSADSSPGTTLKRSPTCTRPLQTLPEIATADDGVLKPFATGKRSGALRSRVGGSSPSVTL